MAKTKRFTKHVTLKNDECDAVAWMLERFLALLVTFAISTSEPIPTLSITIINHRNIRSEIIYNKILECLS